MLDEMVGWTETEVIKGGGAAVSGDTNKPIADEAAKLDGWLGFVTPVFLCPSLACSACSAGIVLNLDQIQAKCRGEVATDPMAVVAYVLAHEKCHHAQAQRKGGWKALQADSVKFELQADFVAGVWIGANILVRDFNFLAVASAAFAVGDPNWPGGTHPAPEQRQIAVQRGVAAAASIVHLQLPGGALEGSLPLFDKVNLDELLHSSWKVACDIESGRF